MAMAISKAKELGAKAVAAPRPEGLAVEIRPFQHGGG